MDERHGVGVPEIEALQRFRYDDGVAPVRGEVHVVGVLDAHRRTGDAGGRIDGGQAVALVVGHPQGLEVPRRDDMLRKGSDGERAHDLVVRRVDLRYGVVETVGDVDERSGGLRHRTEIPGSVGRVDVARVGHRGHARQRIGDGVAIGVLARLVAPGAGLHRCPRRGTRVRVGLLAGAGQVDDHDDEDGQPDEQRTPTAHQRDLGGTSLPPCRRGHARLPKSAVECGATIRQAHIVPVPIGDVDTSRSERRRAWPSDRRRHATPRARRCSAVENAPSAGLEPAPPAPEAGALSAELRGQTGPPAPARGAIGRSHREL